MSGDLMSKITRRKACEQITHATQLQLKNATAVSAIRASKILVQYLRELRYMT